MEFAIDAGDETRVGNVLESVAYLAYRQGAFTEALIILGTVNEWRDFHAVPRPSSINRDCDEIVQAARVALGQSVLAASLQRGGEMTLEQVAEYALDYLGQANSASS